MKSLAVLELLLKGSAIVVEVAFPTSDFCKRGQPGPEKRFPSQNVPFGDKMCSKKEALSRWLSFILQKIRWENPEKIEFEIVGG